MTTKSLKKFTELLNRSEGLSIIPIIVIMVIMSVMGGVFSSIMGGWKISAPITVNSHKAFNLAETAAMFALQDASYRFFSKDASGVPNYPATASGTRSNPYVVYSSSTEEANYWIERPHPSINSVDEYPPGNHRGQNDDKNSKDDDDVVDDDDDDSANSSDKRRYTIIATGKVKIGGTTVATRQIKVKADIIRSADTTVAPGVQTSGNITGTGGGFGMHHNASSTEFLVGTNIDNPPGSSEFPAADPPIVIRPAQTLDENFVKAFAVDQGHYNAVDLDIGMANDNYPEPATPSFYYSGTIPNFTYVGQDLTVGSNRRMFGVVWVKGDVVLNGTATMDAIIICEGDIYFNGTSDIIGGIIHYGGTIVGNGNPNAVTINDSFFDAMSLSIPIVTVQSWQEAVSAK